MYKIFGLLYPELTFNSLYGYILSKRKYSNSEIRLNKRYSWPSASYFPVETNPSKEYFKYIRHFVQFKIFEIGETIFIL